ncbi:hypothetical protein [Agarivorans sp. QJM3NY_25]|uniref:hypothetical protein n=1 Tax=Agarivorans sp. QJM3NY_25 TaxID=3421430 RepID=UPI003D7EB1CC
MKAFVSGSFISECHALKLLVDHEINSILISSQLQMLLMIKQALARGAVFDTLGALQIRHLVEGEMDDSKQFMSCLLSDM